MNGLHTHSTINQFTLCYGGPVLTEEKEEKELSKQDCQIKKVN